MVDGTPQSRSSRPASPFDAVEAGLRADGRLDDAFAVSAPAAAQPGEPRSILLTGATGFLGAFLLSELLRQTTATVHCLVRAPTPDEGLARLAHVQRHYELPDALPSDRVHAVCGDLAQPRLGLAEADYTRLAHTVDTIVHGAAAMNFYQPYEALRDTNVGGTRSVLQFAVTGPTKALHYISSSGVFDARSYLGKIVRETDVPERCDDSVTGYTQSKWVAERLVVAARDRCLPVCVHRPPFIVGHSETGVVDLDNLIVRMMVGCIQGGFWPDEWSPLDIIPVDYVSRAVARLVREPASAERTLHYAGARGLRLADIGRALQAAGYDLELRPFAEWKQELRRFSRQPQNALRPLAPLFLKANARLAKPVPDAFLQPPRPRFDSAATRAFLGGLGVPAPAMDDQLFARYCDYFVRVGWAPPAIETQRGAAAPAPAALPQANA
jgi:thioester reductase-like protein